MLYDTYGPIWKHELVGTPSIVAVTEPTDIEKVFRSDSKFPERPGFLTLKNYREKKTEHFDKSGILVMSGPEWWEIRSKVQQPMLKPQNIAMYLPAMESVSKEMVERIKVLRDENMETPEDFINEMYKWALECEFHFFTLSLNQVKNYKIVTQIFKRNFFRIYGENILFPSLQVKRQFRRTKKKT